ncbi:MAG: hypothetical protein ABFS32_19840 [Bacteroidota bacterium]
MPSKKIKSQQKKGTHGNIRKYNKRKKTKYSRTAEFLIPESSKIRQKHILFGSIFLFLLAAGLYLQTWNYNYVLDDISVLSKNKYVHEGFKGIDNIFTTHLLAGYNEKLPALGYRPVPLTSLAIQYEFSGDRPSHYHIGNILIYALIGVILFITLGRMMIKYPLYFSFIISLLFIVHPVHTEMAANIKNRDEMFGFLFFFTSLLLLLKYHDQKKTWALLTSLIFYFLSLASKESMITSLAVIPLVFYFFRNKSILHALKISIPYFIIFLIFFYIRNSIVAIAQDVDLNKIANPLLAAENINEHLGTISLYFGKYLFTLLFPIELIADYSYKSIDIVKLSNPLAIISILINIFLIIIAYKGLKKRKFYSFTILFYYITISFVLKGFLSGYNAYADRFLFTASLAICFIIGFMLMHVSGQRKEDIIWPKINNKLWVPLMVLFIIIGLSIYKVIDYSPVWKNNMALFQYCVQKVPENARMRKSLGGEFTRMALAEKDSIKQREYALSAINELKIAVSVYDRESTAHSHLGINYGMLGDMENSESALKKSLSINPYSNATNVALANVLFRIGKYHEAIKYWFSADPSYLKPNNLYFISQAYRQIGDNEKADYFLRLSGN